jgi:delta8-fatty-acid desaturase
MYSYVPIFKFFLYLIAPLFVIFSPRATFRVKELILMSGYYIWYGYLLWSIENFNYTLVYFFFNNILTSVVFLQIVLAHLAMPTDPYTEEEEFAKHQIRTSLDIKCSPWVDWWHGGL